MKTSESVKELFTALILAEAELKNPQKSEMNPHFHSGFAPLDVITDLIRPVMAKHGLGVIQDIFGNGDTITVSTMVIHSSGQFIIQEGLTIPLSKKDAHGACGAVTYARRYALLAMLNIVGTNDDDDGNMATISGGNNISLNKTKPVVETKKIESNTNLVNDETLVRKMKISIVTALNLAELERFRKELMASNISQVNKVELNKIIDKRSKIMHGL